MIEKPTIIITSLGRTGTRFFATLFNEILSNAIAIHEPDIIKIGKTYNLFDQVQDFGFMNLFFRKIFNHWSIAEISDDRFIGKSSDDQAANRLYKQRNKFITDKIGSNYDVYVETNFGFYGLIDLVQMVFRNYRLVYIVRDGSEWVRSWMNFGYFYDKNFILKNITHNWPEASYLQHDPYKRQWKHLNRFEKLCWAWNSFNRFALRQIQADPKNCRIYRFEDIFLSDQRNEFLASLIDFVTDFKDHEKLSVKPVGKLLENPIHQSKGSFPSFFQWSKNEKDFFEKMCGSLMSQLQYELVQ